MIFGRIRGDQKGAAAVEFALAVPVFLVMMIGTMQLGRLFLANSGLNSAVEYGARAASIYTPPPGITDAQITAQIDAKQYGLEASRLSEPTISRGTDGDGSKYVDISMSYQQPMDFVFFQLAPVTLTETRRAYIP